MTDSKPKSIDEKLEEIGEKWGQVYLTFYPERDNPYIIRNVKDDVLPVSGERKWSSGNSLDGVLDEALHEGGRGEP